MRKPASGGARMVDGPRLTVREMKRRDWRLLADALPEMEQCDQLQQNLKWLAWGNGWLTKDGRNYGEYLRRVWRGLACGPRRVGPFRVERSGRWGIIFAVDLMYAVQRKTRRRRRTVNARWLDAYEMPIRHRRPVEDGAISPAFLTAV